ncbi:MAG: hypothetical protein MMC33_008233 [Icmadophila ericetorum]|nr:hypothetical protein [Icmadophila ericetorum]
MLGAKEMGRRSRHKHPYLSGNFAPVHRIQPLTPCIYTGKIPKELFGGEYVRNGGNPVTNEELGRDAHWFDGDGMLSGVSFRRNGEKGNEVLPEFVNQYILTDLYMASKTSPRLRSPILPSIATLVNPLSSLWRITLAVFRTLCLVLLSHLPGSLQAIKKISVSNTAVLYHDGRALATCESGPPMRIALPGLETIGWFNGKKAEGEPNGEEGSGFGGDGVLSFMREWTTAHPRVDPDTHELISFHSSFAPPYVHYSIIPPTQNKIKKEPFSEPMRLLTSPVSGVSSAKMMHDFGVSQRHTIIMDLPLSLDPFNLAKNGPVISYDPMARSRFGVFPRYQPDTVRWFETRACCIFHTANTWDTTVTSPKTGRTTITAVNMLACRLTSASLVFSAGDIAAPVPSKPIPAADFESEQCRLYYYQFSLSHTAFDSDNSQRRNVITHQWGLSAIPFEFPSIRDSVAMRPAKYIYGCSVSDSTFGAALGRAVKINTLVKVDAEKLIQDGIRNPPEPIKGCVDMRNVDEILSSRDPDDPIKIFKMPDNWFAQEPRFVPRVGGTSEDDGWLLSYVFDESQLGSDGECGPDARSELWIIDAKNMTDVVASIRLPQRVPYGLHGNWFSEQEILNQRPIERLRSLPDLESKPEQGSTGWKMWMATRRLMERRLA